MRESTVSDSTSTTDLGVFQDNNKAVKHVLEKCLGCVPPVRNGGGAKLIRSHHCCENARDKPHLS